VIVPLRLMSSAQVMTVVVVTVVRGAAANRD
jgi:hypothetical protein